MNGVWQGGRFVLQSTLENREQKLIAGLRAVAALMAESSGVAGLDLNGEVAPWNELRLGGRREEWLRSFDEAMAIVQESSPCPK